MIDRRFVTVARPARLAAWIGLLCVLALTPLTAGPAFGQELDEPAGPVFSERIDVGLRQLYVTVVDWRGNLVRDLERDDFTLEDDGTRQDLVTFEGGEMPFSAVILVDASGSMAGSRLEAAIRGVETFTERMEDLDLARVVVFTDHVRAASEWSGEPGVVSEPLSSVQGAGGSAVFDHLFLGLRLVHERAGRPVVILLSDGWDMHSVLGVDDLEREMEIGGVQVYWMRDALDVPGTGRYLGDAEIRRGQLARVVPRSVWRDETAARARYKRLEGLVDASGGRAMTFRDDAGLEQAFEDLLEELRAQYALGWYPEPDRPEGTWRKLEVDVDGGRPRHRSGYVEGRRR